MRSTHLPFDPASSSVILMTTFILQFILSNQASDLQINSLPFSSHRFLKHNLQECTCFILHDLPRHHSSIIVDVIISLAVQNSGGTFIANIKTTADLTSPSLATYTKLQDVNKVHPKCSFGIIHISRKTTLDNLPALYKFLQNSNGIIKTDEDKFLFVSSSELILDEMLTSKKFGSRFKFALAFQDNMDKMILKSYCYFCKDLKHNSYNIESSNSNSPEVAIAFQDRTRNFHGNVFQISTPTSTRWLNEMHTVNNTWIPKRGIYSIVLDQLMLRYNFTAHFFPSTGGGTGGKLNKTHWTGTVGDVLQEKADLGHVTAVTLSRLMVVDASFPISYEWLTFTTGKAEEYHTWKTVYWPFTPMIWQLTALTCIVGAVVFKLDLKVTGQKSRIGKVIEYMFAVIMEQGVKDPERFPTFSLRITIVVWLIFGLIMGTAYRSKLTAFLAFPHIEHLPQSFEELSRSHYQIGLQYIKGAAYQILKTSTHPTYATIFKRMELEESDVKCFKRTLTSDFACISWDSIADYVYHKNLTDKFGRAPLTKAPDSTCFLTAGLVMPKRSILKTGIDNFLMWAMDTGMISIWNQFDHDYVAAQRKNWEKETSQPEIDYSPPKNTALSFAHLSGGYYIFCVGIFIAVFGFVGEKVYRQYVECMGLQRKPPHSDSIDIPSSDDRYVGTDLIRLESKF